MAVYLFNTCVPKLPPAPPPPRRKKFYITHYLVFKTKIKSTLYQNFWKKDILNSYILALIRKLYAQNSWMALVSNILRLNYNPIYQKREVRQIPSPIWGGEWVILIGAFLSCGYISIFCCLQKQHAFWKCCISSVPRKSHVAILCCTDDATKSKPSLWKIKANVSFSDLTVMSPVKDGYTTSCCCIHAMQQHHGDWDTCQKI